LTFVTAHRERDLPLAAQKQPGHLAYRKEAALHSRVAECAAVHAKDEEFVRVFAGFSTFGRASPAERRSGRIRIQPAVIGQAARAYPSRKQTRARVAATPSLPERLSSGSSSPHSSAPEGFPRSALVVVDWSVLGVRCRTFAVAPARR
jgi:hypothetical protein